jgi:hypothetical protein
LSPFHQGTLPIVGCRQALINSPIFSCDRGFLYPARIILMFDAALRTSENPGKFIVLIYVCMLASM